MSDKQTTEAEIADTRQIIMSITAPIDHSTACPDPRTQPP